MHKKLNTQLVTELKKFKAPTRPEMFHGENYVGGGSSKLIFWNLSMPDVRSLQSRNLVVKNQPLDVQFTAFEKIWKTAKVFELKTISIHWLEKLSDQDLVRYAPQILTWANEVDNWAHSDALCGIFARIFEASPKSVLRTYKAWNRHKNPWLRRCSMVGLFYYSRSRKSLPSFKLASSMIKPHLNAPEYYVQKAVGWTIREMYNVYPQETLQFIEVNLDSIHPNAWYASSEKLPLKIKNKLVIRRKLMRREMPKK